MPNPGSVILQGITVASSENKYSACRSRGLTQITSRNGLGSIRVICVICGKIRNGWIENRVSSIEHPSTKKGAPKRALVNCWESIYRFFPFGGAAPAKAAFRKSLFILAMPEIDISFGHTASHEVKFVQAPNASRSIASTICRARFALSG